ncbi:hypothetical protein BpHYR1_049666 [Brachionus plicatilis]|uniref:Uncharacterized protein n=1 Tax=Brachionus plicatilis TaxID=10195 RepID=A0A3M7R5G3_BRAPC|nr:hypothetical protein BpHYR1_049666 [Brachionus plicatilis]
MMKLDFFKYSDLLLKNRLKNTILFESKTKNFDLKFTFDHELQFADLEQGLLKLFTNHSIKVIRLIAFYFSNFLKNNSFSLI